MTLSHQPAFDVAHAGSETRPELGKRSEFRSPNRRLHAVLDLASTHGLQVFSPSTIAVVGDELWCGVRVEVLGVRWGGGALGF